MWRLFSISVLILISPLASAQTYDELVQQGNFKAALEKAERPVLKIHCALEISQWALGDSLLRGLEIDADHQDYALYNLSHGRIAIRQKKHQEARAYLNKGLKTLKGSCEIEQELKETLAYLDLIKGNKKSLEQRFLNVLKEKEQCGVSNYGKLKAYNKLMQYYYYSSDYKKSLEMTRAATKLIAQDGMTNSLTAKMWNNQGVVEKKLGKLNEAKISYKKALYIHKQLVDSLYDPILNAGYNNIANIHFSLEEVEIGMRYLDTLELIQIKGANNPDAFSSIYLNRGNYGKTIKEKIHFYEKILQIKDQVSMERKGNVLQAYNNLAMQYQQQGNFVEAENYSTELLNYLNQLDIQPKEFISRVLERRASLHAVRFNHTQAIANQEKALELIIASQGNTNRNAVISSIKLGTFLLIDKQYDKAEQIFQASRRILDQLYEEEHPIKGIVKMKIGELNLEQNKDPDQTIELLENGIEAIGKNPLYISSYLPKAYYLLSKAYEQKNDSAAAEKSRYAMMKQVGFQPSSSQIHLDGILEHDGFTAIQVYYWYLEAKESLAPYEVEAAIELFQMTRSNFFFEQSELDFKKTAKKLFERCLEDQFVKWQRNRDPMHTAMAFRLMEHYKSGSLDRPFIRRESFRSDLPDTIISQEKKIIYQYELAYQDYKNYQDNSYQGKRNEEELQEAIIRWQQEKKQFLSQLKTDYPDYYRKRYKGRISSLAKVQEEPVSYLSNFWGEKALYSLLINQDSSWFQRAPIAAIQENLTSVTDFLSGSNSLKGETEFQADKSMFIQQSHQLFTVLLEPLMPYIDKTKPLCVIPDRQLWYLPYDVLLTESATANSSYRELPYLLQQLTIQYDVSVSLNARKSKHRSSRTPYVGFAPSYDGAYTAENQRNRQALYATSAEISSAAKQFNGKHFQGATANKANFMKAAPSANILHLAMHAEVNDQAPMRSALQFYNEDSPDPLYLYDIAQLDLNNQLVILSACATQQGNIAPGEGLLSISRAFQLAGSPNIVNTRWPVNDWVAGQLIGVYLKQLPLGNSRSMRFAKQSYLNGCSEYYAHPGYWSAFNYQGRAERISSSFRWSNWVILGLVSLLVVVGYLVFLPKKE